jgi:hypothetical protein
MLTDGDYCRAKQINGGHVTGWIVCGRAANPTHLHLEARGGVRSDVCVSLNTLKDIERWHASEAQPSPAAD